MGRRMSGTHRTGALKKGELSKHTCKSHKRRGENISKRKGETGKEKRRRKKGLAYYAVPGKNTAGYNKG